MPFLFHLPRRSLLAMAASAVLLPGVALACGPITGKGDINIVAPAFPSTQLMAK